MRKINTTKNIRSLTIFDKRITSTITLNESLLLNQIEYWIYKCGRNIGNLDGKWIYNSLNEWHKQFNYWSLSTLRRTIKSLEKSGILISRKINAKKWNHTKWYSIDYNKLNQLIKHTTINKEYSATKELNNSSNFNSLNNSIYNSKNKRTNRYVQNEQIIITKNNYTNKSSYKKNNVVLENTLKEKIEENPINANEKEIINKMVYIWNKVFEYSISPIKAYSNQKNQEVLLNLYKTAFSGDLNNWREYACKVNSSQFLMGEKKTKNNFKAVFSWLIKEETIEKIMNGEYGVGDRELDINNKSKNGEIKKEEKVTELEKQISSKLKENINELKELEEFRNYIEEECYQEDNNKYKLGLILRHIPKRDFLNKDEYKLMRDRLFESYLMKKYTKRSRLEIRDQIRDAVSKESKEIIFNKSREVQELSDYLQGNIKNYELLMGDISRNQVNTNNQLN